MVNKQCQLEKLPEKICGFFGAFKKQNENSRRCLWKERPAHIFHHRSLDLSFIVLAPPQNIKQKGAFSSILRATLLMRKNGAFAGLARCTYGVWPFSPSETFVAGAIKSPRMRGGCESPVRCRQCLRLGMLLGPGRTWSHDQKWKEGAALCAKLLCKPALKPGSPENV